MLTDIRLKTFGLRLIRTFAAKLNACVGREIKTK